MQTYLANGEYLEMLLKHKNILKHFSTQKKISNRSLKELEK